MKHQQMLSCLLLTAMLLVVQGLDHGPDTPLERAVQHMRNQKTKPQPIVPREVRSTHEEENPCVTIPFLTKLKKRFVRSLDHNNDGMATFDEVKDYLRRVKFNVKDEDVQAFIHRRDTNGNRAIDLVPEYVHDMAVPDYTIESATEWFRLQDTNDDGFVSENELMNTTQALGIPPEDALSTVQGYYMAADANSDGQLSFDEFKTLYNQ